jgi:hypothetical protein
MRNYKILSLALLALLFLFGACGTDEAEPEPEPTNADLIAATWKINDIEVGLVAFGQPTTFEDFGFTNPVDSLVQQDIQLEFKAGGTLVTTFTSADANLPPVVRNGTWVFLENETKVKLSGLFATEDFNSDFIDADFINDLETYQIDKLTSSEMELTSEVQITIEDPSLPLPVPVTINITLTLAKQ